MSAHAELLERAAQENNELRNRISELEQEQDKLRTALADAFRAGTEAGWSEVKKLWAVVREIQIAAEPETRGKQPLKRIRKICERALPDEGER